MLPGQSWKIEAQQAIDRHRKAPLHITVVNQAGEAVEGMEVAVRMREHFFRWGTTSSISHILSLEQEGVQLEDNHPYMLHFRNFNSVTPENAGKWNFWRDNRSRSKYLATLPWFDQLGIANRGHTTIWPSITRWSAVPAFVVNASAKTENGVVIKSREDVIREHVQNHIESQLPVLEPHIYEIDLVNELINEGEIVKLLLKLPPEERPLEHALWYQWAKAAAPSIDLVVNEYDLFQSGNNFHQTYVEYVRAMVDAGAPVDAVGMQGHFFSNMPSYAELKKRLAEVAVLNLPMSVTEFDMRGSSYTDMERVLYAIFSEPLVYGFTMWGAWDGRQWRNNAPMFTEDWQLKPSGKAWMDLVKHRWWTDTVLTTRNGEIATEGYLGDYSLIIEDNGLVTMTSETLTSDGLDVRIVLGDGSFPQPAASLIIAGGERSEFYANEPINVELQSTDSVLSVEYFLDDLIQGVFAQPPFQMNFKLRPGQEKEVHAEVEFSSGYKIVTPKQSVAATLANQSPTIHSIFPSAGSTWLKSEVTHLFVNASDIEGDSLQFILLDSGGDEILRVNDPAPIPLSDVSLGSNYFTIRVQDHKYGFADQFYFLNFIEDGVKQMAQGSPLTADDDIEEKSDGEIDVTGDLDLGEKLTGIRFPIVSIPPGSIIDSAFVLFTSQKAEQDGMASCRIRAEKSINARPLSTNQNELTARTLSDQSITWNLPVWCEVNERSLLQRTPDLQPLLNELVNQSGWTDSSRVHLLFETIGSASKRSAYSIDQVQEFGPHLMVYYRSDFSVPDPDPPFDFEFVQTSDNAGVLKWQEPSETTIEGYKIFINDTFPRLALEPALELSNLRSGIEYRVAGKTIGARGAESVDSDHFAFMLGTVDISDESHERTLSIWPNPVQEKLFVKISASDWQPMAYKILARNGQIIQRGTMRAEDFVLDVQSLPSGVYFLSLSHDHHQPLVTRWTKL